MRHHVRVWCVFALLAGCAGEPDLAVTRQAAVTVRPPLVTDTQRIGTLPGTFAVSSEGSAGYTIPIEVAPGRAGMQPSLSLAYQSRSGTGILGVAWSLQGLSHVAPCGRTQRADGETRPVQFAATDRMCLDGARLVLLGTSGACSQGVVCCAPRMCPSDRLTFT